MLAGAVALASFSVVQGAHNVEVTSNGSTGSVILEQTLKIRNLGPENIQVRHVGSSSWQYTITAGYVRNFATTQGFAYTASGGQESVPYTYTEVPYIEVRVVGDEFDTIAEDGPQGVIMLTSLGSGSSNVTHTLPEIVVEVSKNGATLTIDVQSPYGADPPPEPVDPEDLEQGILMIENTTGEDVVVPFGDEELLLKPGYNTFPFLGEVDPATGLPMAAIDNGIGMNRTTAPDGTPIYNASFGYQVEGRDWDPSPPVPDVFAPDNPGDGPVLKLPGTRPGTSDYVQLPAGVTPGNNVPLPAGVTPGTPGLPPGVMPGTNGALPSGVISGGSGYLPPGVSAGTEQGAGGGASGSGTSGGGSGGSGGSGGGTGGGGGSPTGGNPAGGVTVEGPGEPYVPGPDMSGLEGEGIAKGEAIADQVMQGVEGFGDGLGEVAANPFGEDGFKFWTGEDSVFSGFDDSWTRFEFNYGGPDLHIIEIPPHWLALIRAIMLWVIKFSFVIGVVRLFIS